MGLIWKKLELWTREIPECCRKSLKGNSGGSSESQNADRSGGSKDCIQKASDGNKNSIENWTRGYSRHIVAENLSTFFP
jgi:hypothetical protein